jgi:CxxC motif-containing protein
MLTCIICPRGCRLTVALDGDGRYVSTEGNACKRGEAYAKDECTDPRRTVTSTVVTDRGRLLPVKTSAPIPKGRVMEAMEIIRRVIAPDDAEIGDVIVEDLIGIEGISLVCTGHA